MRKRRALGMLLKGLAAAGNAGLAIAKAREEYAGMGALRGAGGMPRGAAPRKGCGGCDANQYQRPGGGR
jgi:hypothetical protein